MALRDTGKPALPTTPKVEYSAAEIGALAHLYRGEDYRSTVWRTRLDSTTNWAVVATGIALSATFSSAEASRTGRSDRHCVPSVRGPPLPVFQRLASTCLFTRDRFLRADDQRRRHSVRCGLGRVAGEGLLRSALPHQLRPCGWSAASPHIRLDLCDPGRRVLRQARYSPDAAYHPCRPLGACRHWSDPRWPSCCCGSAIPWRMGGIRARHVSHRGRLSTRASEPDCDGIANGRTEKFVAGRQLEDNEGAGLNNLRRHCSFFSCDA